MRGGNPPAPFLPERKWDRGRWISSRLLRPATSGPGFMSIVCWWSVVVAPPLWVLRRTPRLPGCWLVTAPINLRRGSRPHGWLVSIRVTVRVRYVSWTPLAI